MSDGAVIDVRDVTKVYKMGDVEVRALRGVTFRSRAANTSRSWGRRARASRR